MAKPSMARGVRSGPGGSAPRAPLPMRPRGPGISVFAIATMGIALLAGCGSPAPAGAPAGGAHEISVLLLDGAGVPRSWIPIQGTWTPGREGLVGQPDGESSGAPAFLDTQVYLEGAYRAEVWLRSPSGPACGPGILFGSGRPETTPWGISVHLQGPDRVHVAVVRAGRRTEIAAADAPRPAGPLRRLAVDVQPRSFRVEVDGVPVTEPIALPSNEGFVALESGADGGIFAAFRSLASRDLTRGPDAIAFAAGVAVDGFGRFIIADRGRHAILVHSPHAVPLESFGPPDVALARPEAVAIGERETILVADTGHARIVILDWSGRFLRAIPAAAIGLGSAPRWLASDARGRGYVSSPETGEVIAFDADGAVVARTREPFRRPEALSIARNGRAAIADPGEGVAWIGEAARDGRLIVRDRIPIAGGVRAVVLDPAGRLIVGRADDVLCHDPRIGKPRSWRSPSLGDLDIQSLALGRDGSVIAADGANHRVIRIDDPATVLPPTASFPAPDRAEISWRSRGAVATMVHYGIAAPLRRRALDPTPRTMHRIELAGLEPATHYRFRASGAPFAIPPEMFTAELDFVTPPPAGRTAYREILFQVRVAAGREEAARGWAEQARRFWWLASRMRIHAVFAVASGDAAVPADAAATIVLDDATAPAEFRLRPPSPACGITGFACVPDRGPDSPALIVRAVHAMLGELARRAGHPEVLAARGDPGRPIDGDLRAAGEVAPWVWLVLEAGTLRLADDGDGDGIPDSAPDLPLDEVRFGSDPMMPDTDGDRVPDLDEARFATGLDDGWEESASTARAHPDPRGPDSDGDGVDDRADGDPLRAAAGAVPWSPGPEPMWVPAGTIAGPGVEGEISLAWSAEGVRLAWRGSGTRRVRIDAEREGTGRVVRITADLETKAAAVATIDAPFATPALRTTETSLIVFEHEGDAGASSAFPSIRIPSMPDLALAWDPGARYAIEVAAEDATGRMRVPGEPNRPARIRLGVPEDGGARPPRDSERGVSR